MSLLSAAALAALRDTASGLLAAEAGTECEIELLGSADTGRDSFGQRTKGERSVIATVGGVLMVESATARRLADRPVGERTATLVLPYDTDLDNVAAYRISGTTTVWEPLAGEDNRDTSYRVTTDVRVREVRL